MNTEIQSFELSFFDVLIEFLKVIKIVAGFVAHYKVLILLYPPESIKY
jgi:hypothetical protein